LWRAKKDHRCLHAQALHHVSLCETVHSAVEDCYGQVAGFSLSDMRFFRRCGFLSHRGDAVGSYERAKVLLRAVDGAWEGWRCMAMEEFLQRVDLDAWKAGQVLVGMVLPPRRQQIPN
jgi:hypothetical protein